MLRFLIRLYLVVLITGCVAVTFVNYCIPPLFHERVTGNVRHFMAGYAFLLSDYFERNAGPQQSHAIDILRQHDNLDIVPAISIKDLTPQQQKELTEGKIVLSSDTDRYYLPLNKELVARGEVPEPGDYVIAITAFLTISLAMFFSVAIWIRFQWRDLRRLQAAATTFGNGMLSTRAKISSKSDVYLLAIQFNEMAARIENLLEQQRDMMNGISHELKTPLARLKFGIALLKPNETGEDQSERCSALQKDVRELDELVTEFLTLGQLEHGASNLELMQVSVNELLDSVAASVDDDISSQSLALDLDYNNGPPHYFCDPTLIARALLNLIRNSIRYATQKIIVKTQYASDGGLMFIVEDDGPGIPLAEQARVFEPFYRSAGSFERHNSGFGIGLAIVRRIALLHGGDCRVEASQRGGARFIIVLPNAKN